MVAVASVFGGDAESGGLVVSAGDELRSIEEFDAEIEQLQAERKRLQFLLQDPEQREARRTRREQLAGRWVVQLPLSRDHVAEIGEVSGVGESWLWDPDVLKADGWDQDEEGSWLLSSEGDDE